MSTLRNIEKTLRHCAEAGYPIAHFDQRACGLVELRTACGILVDCVGSGAIPALNAFGILRRPRATSNPGPRPAGTRQDPMGTFSRRPRRRKLARGGSEALGFCRTK